MNERFNRQDEFDAFLDSDEVADGLKQYLMSLLEAHQTESLTWTSKSMECHTTIDWPRPSRQIQLGSLSHFFAAFSSSLLKQLLASWKAIAELRMVPEGIRYRDGPRTDCGCN